MLSVVVAMSLAAAPGIGVMDFGAEGGASPDLASGLSTLASQELERLGVFRVTSSQSTRVLLGLERQRQLLGCENCSGEGLADLTTFDYVLSGKVLKLGGELTLMMSIIPVGKKGTPGSSTRVKAPTDSRLMLEAGPAVLKLVGKLLEGRQGTAVFTSSEVGAAVKVDDTQVGTTPLSALKVAGGPHLISVEKDGFTTSRKEVRILPDQTVVEQFTLVPSPDTIAAYEARTGRVRVLAWTAVGVAVAGAAVFALGQLEADAAYGSANTKGTFLYYQGRLLQGLETEPGTDAAGKAIVLDNRKLAGELKSSIETWQYVSVSALALAGLGAVAAVVLFVVGEPPDKYSAFHASLVAAPGVGGLVFSGRF